MFPSRPERIYLAQLPTPLQYLERVSDALGGPRIWVKRDDLTGAALTGNKVRKLEYLLADAKAAGAQVLITCGGIQSNHCRATALVAAQAGLRAHLVLRGEGEGPADGNFLLDKLAGATAALYSAADYQQNLPQLLDQWAEHFSAQGLQPYVIPTGGSNAVGLWGYIDAAHELHQQFDTQRLSPDYVVCATGSGGTQAGLTLGLSQLRPQTQVLGMAVCDSASYFRNKVTKDVAAWTQRYSPHFDFDPSFIKTCDRYIGPGYGIAREEIFKTIAWLARTEGLLLDPVYTGKAFHGLMQEVKCGQLQNARDIVFVHTGGVFGLFPYKSQFAQLESGIGDS